MREELHKLMDDEFEGCQVGVRLSQARFYTAEIINALAYLRESGIAHRDLKPPHAAAALSGGAAEATGKAVGPRRKLRRALPFGPASAVPTAAAQPCWGPDREKNSTNAAEPKEITIFQDSIFVTGC